MNFKEWLKDNYPLNFEVAFNKVIGMFVASHLRLYANEDASFTAGDGYAGAGYLSGRGATEREAIKDFIQIVNLNYKGKEKVFFCNWYWPNSSHTSRPFPKEGLEVD